MTTADKSNVDQHPSAPFGALEKIVLRADRLGFCRHRVATALGMPTEDLSAIERRNGLTACAQQAIADPR